MKTIFRKTFVLLLALMCALNVTVFSTPAFAEDFNDKKELDRSVTSNVNNMIWSGNQTTGTITFTKSMKNVTYRGVIGLFGSNGVVVLNFDHLDANGNVDNWKTYTFACNGTQYTSSDFSPLWPAGTYNVTLVVNTTSNLSNLFINFSN